MADVTRADGPDDLRKQQDPTLDRPASDSTQTDPSDDRLDELAEEFARLCRKGEAPSISSFARLHPEFSSKIERLFPAIARLEQLGRRSRSTAGQVHPPETPARLGEFRIVRELGRGGMGIVYEAVQETLGRHVALKVLHHNQVDARRLQRFQREAQVIARLHHTNIVPIFGVGDHEGFPYYAMQYIRGSGLDVLLHYWREEGPPPIEERARFAARVIGTTAEALQYAHEQGVLHRDIKPANLLINKNDAVWVTDFGLAKLVGEQDLTGTGDVIGTLRYLAPEALRGETGPRSDVYSLGLTLYELLTLTPPFGELNPSELLRQVSDGQPIPPRLLDPGISADLETVILTAIARDPGHRYETAGALAEDLHRVLEDRPILARRATSLEKSWRWARRNRVLASLMATAAGSLLLAAVVGMIGYAVTNSALKSEFAKRKEAQEATNRANANVQLSLKIFGELFDKLSPDVDIIPPPTGRRRGEMSPPHPGGPDPGGPVPPPGFPPWPHDNGGGIRAAMGMGPGGPDGFASARDAELLQSILTFYEEFAKQNQGNVSLQHEAARAYFRVGTLREHMGQADEAELAYAEAIKRYEDLVARFPNETSNRAELVKLFIMADPWEAAETNLERMVVRLERARDLLNDLESGGKRESEWIRSRIHVEAKLGAAYERLGRLDQSEASYNKASRAATDLLGRMPNDFRARMDRVDILEGICRLRVAEKHPEKARSLLPLMRDDLAEFAVGNPLTPIILNRLENLAQLALDLNDPDFARSIADQVKQARAEWERRRPSPDFDGRPNEPHHGVPGRLRRSRIFPGNAPA